MINNGDGFHSGPSWTGISKRTLGGGDKQWIDRDVSGEGQGWPLLFLRRKVDLFERSVGLLLMIGHMNQFLVRRTRGKALVAAVQLVDVKTRLIIPTCRFFARGNGLTFEYTLQKR